MRKTGLWQALTRERSDEQWSVFAPFVSAGLLVAAGVYFRAERIEFGWFFFVTAGLFLAIGVATYRMRAARPQLARSLPFFFGGILMTGFGAYLLWSVLFGPQHPVVGGVSFPLILFPVICFAVALSSLIRARRMYNGRLRDVIEWSTASALISGLLSIGVGTYILIAGARSGDHLFYRFAVVLAVIGGVMLSLAWLHHKGIIGRTDDPSASRQS